MDTLQLDVLRGILRALLCLLEDRQRCDELLVRELSRLLDPGVDPSDVKWELLFPYDTNSRLTLETLALLGRTSRPPNVG